MSDIDDPTGDDDMQEIDMQEIDDAALMTELRAAANLHEPVPGHLVEFARVAPELRRMDDELAELLDTAALAGVRSEASDAVISFAGPETSIDIDISDRRLLGQIVPPTGASITLEGTDGVIDEASCDERGRFSFAIPRGLVRIVAVAQSATTSTEWFVL